MNANQEKNKLIYTFYNVIISETGQPYDETSDDPGIISSTQVRNYRKCLLHI